MKLKKEDIGIYRENDNINYELREKYSRMSFEEVEKLLFEMEAEVRKQLGKE